MPNKDFYSFIPRWMQVKLDQIAEKYGLEDWFLSKWNEFRKIAKSVSMRDIPDPDGFFGIEETEDDVIVASDNEESIAFAEEDLVTDIFRSDEELKNDIKENSVDLEIEGAYRDETVDIG